MAVDVNTGFDDQDYLRDIRKVVLNPIAVKVANLDKATQDIRTEMEPMFQGVTADIPGKVIVFHQKNGNEAPVELAGMFREGSDLKVIAGDNKEESNVTEIKFTDSTMIKDLSGGVEILYNWGKLVPDNQEKLTVGKAGAVLTGQPKALYFKGPSVKVDQTTADITTVEFPVIPDEFKASISSGTVPSVINEIFLDGNLGSSTLVNGKLTINLPDGGSGTFSEDNFKGFFASLGDLISKVSDPKNGKSYAFVQDTQYGGFYYTPYFYVNGAWKELKQDPALTYSNTSSATTQGVFSIKPSDKIQVDSNGQLDLDGLSTPQLPSYFKGFFNDIQELKDAVPNPVLDQDWAYVKDATGWKIYRNELHGQTSRKWNIKAPLGSFAAINRKDDPNSYAQVYGIYKNDAWDVDSKGIMSLKPIETDTDVTISDQAGATTGGKIKSIKFDAGKPLAEIVGTELVLKNPQQVFNYSASWEAPHPVQDYRGSFYYDATSQTWMGCDDPKEGGGVGVKWTRVAHRGMSDEVKSLVRRVPAKAPSVEPGILDDSGYWHFNGVTFLEKDNDQLPSDIQGKCGAYITTTVQNKDAAGVDIPQYRMQTCTADRDEGGTWVRRYVTSGSAGGDVYWTKWVRTSFSHKDMEAHSADPGAHKGYIKFHKAVSFSSQYSTFYNQSVGGSAGGVRGENCSLMVDNYGARMEDQDYMQPAYSGKFRVSGTVSFAGYTDGKNLPANGQWNVLVRLKHKNASSWSTIGHFRSESTPINTKKFPILSFTTDPVEILNTDEVIINITHTDTPALVRDHKGLYFVPLRSFFVLEDEHTRAGSLIATTFGKYIGNKDVMQGVGLRVHHSDLNNPNSTVRVYGEAMPKDATPMIKLQ